jgi:hypothetical protein
MFYLWPREASKQRSHLLSCRHRRVDNLTPHGRRRMRIALFVVVVVVASSSSSIFSISLVVSIIVGSNPDISIQQGLHYCTSHTPTTANIMEQCDDQIDYGIHGRSGRACCGCSNAGAFANTDDNNDDDDDDDDDGDVDDLGTTRCYEKWLKMIGHLGGCQQFCSI